MSDLLTVEGLTIEFRTPAGTVRAANELSFRVPAGRTVAIVGESGSGKSVTGLAILGLLPKVAAVLGGRILFRDPAAPSGAPPIDLASLKRDSHVFRSIRGDRIAMIFQDPTAALSPLHTIGDQIGEALRIHRGVEAGEARGASIELLGEVGFADPERAFDTYSFELSGGLCQRAMIAMAMICRPALIIADEPTTALDVTVQAEIMQLLNRLQAEHGTAILLIAHDLGVVANMAHEMVVVHHGEAMERGTAADLFADPRHPYLKALLHAVPRLGMNRAERLKPLREIRVDPAAASRTARDRAKGSMQTSVAAGDVFLKVRGITKSFAASQDRRWLAAAPQRALAVRDVSFDIRRGECLGLVGESGCGKTTLSKILVRSEATDVGTVEMIDAGATTDVLALSGEALRQWRRRVQYVFQNPYSALNPRMTVGAILDEPLAIHGLGDERWRRHRVKELLHLVGLDSTHLNRYPHGFSGGQRQRIGIARALALEPELIIFDEPVSALDVSVQAQILNLLRDLREALGLTYLFISHNLGVVDYLADRIAVMAAGRLVEIAPREALFCKPRHPYTQALIAAIPEPDPDRRLDFARLRRDRSSDPASWPWPFGPSDGGEEPHLLDLGGGHYARSFAAPAVDGRVAPALAAVPS
ncbi:ABC transporter ATP-binding protein [Mangrovicella endophytica]|uniref:dipeptide ABC transporter ATP-binding protein n=1 Tax=Mangrovicella endophytica TaxID=2066697 RepID=UPI000C9DB128|nr:ABC transporter ATP-binding protein [Mangrovicella endophytica]